MKQLLFTALTIVLPLLVSSQSIAFSKATKIDLENISLRQVTKDRGGFYGAAEGQKFLILNGTLMTKAQRRIELPLHKLFLKTEDSTYMATGDVSYVAFSELDRYIRFRKKSKRKIYFQVDENFKEGTLIYDSRVLGSIIMAADQFNAAFTASKTED